MFAWFFTLSASLSCNYVRIYQDTPFFNSSQYDLGIGIWTVEDPFAVSGDLACRKYPDGLKVDGTLRFARAMARISTLVSLVILIMICVPACWKVDRKLYLQPVAMVCFGLSITTILTLVRPSSLFNIRFFYRELDAQPYF